MQQWRFPKGLGVGEGVNHGIDLDSGLVHNVGAVSVGVLATVLLLQRKMMNTL